MSFSRHILVALLFLAVAVPSLGQYQGGDGDGSGSGSICVSTLDGTGLFSFVGLVGSTTFCEGATEVYTIAINNAPADIDYFWSVPAGATIVSGQNSPSILVAFGSNPGTVSVSVVTFCGTSNFSQGVAVGDCTLYQGGIEDGFSQSPACVTTLNGTPLTSVDAAIVGSATFCPGSTEAYSLGVTDAPGNIYFRWSGPAGSTVALGQGTSTAIINFGSVAGSVTVDVVTDCGTITRTLAVTPGICTMYAGGDNDGFSEAPSCSTDLNGGPNYSVVGIVGSTSFCEFGTEGFSVATNNAPGNTYYNWSVPAGATILSGQGTATILVLFGNTGGSVGVDVVTDCSTITPTPLAVTTIPCGFYNGGTNDGFSLATACARALDGTSILSLGTITGSTTFCDFATETYSINPVGVNVETTIVWSVPAGAVITSGQGTNTILVTFSNTSGNVSVTLSNPCETQTTSIAVVSTPCVFYAGGTNDGFSSVLRCATNLNGGSVFSAGSITGTNSSCNFSTESYSITVAGALPTTIYNWSVPAGATILSGQGTSAILVGFANNSGNVSVAVSNDCETINVNLPVAISNCIFYAGGNNDGFSTTQKCATNLNGGSVFVPGSIVGPANSCNFSTEAYSITVAGSTPSTIYTWTVPAGASIVSGQGTSSILVAFANNSGNVAVDVSNLCETINVSTPVTIANCIFYAGGNNDGFSTTQACATNLNGGSAFVAGPIVGTTTFCNFSTDSYTISVTGTTATTTYTWTVPPGAAIVSGQGTTTILVSFANNNGNVAVAIANECQTVNVSLAVTATNCIFYAGGTGDGFAVTTITNKPLPISLVSFDATVQNGIVYLNWKTSSELENDFFLVERSRDGVTFESLAKVDGAGTTKESMSYQVADNNPYRGTSYYRLSQTDFDGSTAYFRVVLVRVEGFGEVTKLYPNPVDKDDQLHVDFFAEEDGPVKISIVDPAGRTTESAPIEATAGVNLYQFTPHFPTAGVYIIIIRSREKAQALRLVVR